MDSNLSDLSQSDTEFNLSCWVLNKSYSPFLVNIRKNKTVDHLKKEIKKEMELAGITHDTLTLWKLSSPIPFSEHNDKLRHAQTSEEIAGCVQLSPFDKLSEQFSSPPPKHVHIIVQLPHNPTQSTDSIGDTGEHQLRLLCKKYWNKGDKGRHEIYRNWTVQVPFIARPGAVTTSNGMVTAAQDAIPVASKTASASSGDTNEGSNEELHEESDLGFDTNCPVSYKALSLGSDFPDFFCEGYSSILVRKEYRDMLQHISALRRNGERGVVVTGMPGIGKSLFLYFVLVERILNGQCTAYQCSARVTLILGRDNVQIFPKDIPLDSRGFPGTWALVDSNAELVHPRGEFMSTHSKFYLVQAASPQPVRWKGWKKQLSATIAVMRPWSWEELYIGGTKFIFPALNDSTLRNICDKYGGSARHCFDLAKCHVKVTEWEEEIPNLLAGIPADIAISEGHIAELPSQLITIIPDQTRHPSVTLVSRHIAEHFFKAVLVKNHEKFWNYFNHFSSVSESRTAAGWLWELYARMVLSTRNTQTTPISLCQLSPIGSSQPPSKKNRPNPIELPFFDVTVHSDWKDLGERLSRAIPSLPPTKSTLFRPGAKNQVTFDALSISGDNIVTLYQATIRESHSIKAKGLDFVWDALRVAKDQGTDIKKLLPPSAKWRLVFLIPEEAEKHWKTVQDINFGGIKPERQWGKYVEQFVGVLQKGTMTMADLISYSV